MARKSRKSKKTYDTKQKQSQVQKVIVNIGEKKKSKKKRRARRPREPSQEAQEYAQAISQIIPKIQYNFPQHSSFNYDAYQTPNLVQQTTPNDVSQKQDSASLGKTIPILQSVKADQKENLAQQVDKGFTAKSKFKDEDFVVRKPEPNELNIKKPQPSSTMGRTLPINHPDRIPDLTQGLKAFEKNEQGDFYADFKTESKNKEAAKNRLSDEEKKEAKLVKAIKRREANPPKPRGRPKKSPEPPVVEEKEMLPIIQEEKPKSLADLQNKAQEIAKLEKQVRTGKTITVKKPSALSVAKSAASTVGGLALDVGKEVGKTVIENAVKSVF